MYCCCGGFGRTSFILARLNGMAGIGLSTDFRLFVVSRRRLFLKAPALERSDEATDVWEETIEEIKGVATV